MRTLKVLVVASVVLVALAPSILAATAGGGDQNNIFRGGLFWSHPTGDLNLGGFKFEADDDFGIQASYERKFNDLLGLNLNIGYVEYDVKIKGGGLDDTFAKQPTLPVSLNLLFHPLENKQQVDWYIGGGLTYVQYDDADVESPFKAFAGSDTIKSDNDTAFSAQTGVDIKFGDGTWALNFDLQYIHTSADDLDIDPFNFGAGVAIRW